MTSIRSAVAAGVIVLTALVGLSACSATGSADAPPPAHPSEEASGAAVAPQPDEGAAEDRLSYAERLTPAAMAKKATDIRVEGDHAWVTVPVESTSASSILECLQLLPAREDGETLTVIFSDGVEQLCEWE